LVWCRPFSSVLKSQNYNKFLYFYHPFSRMRLAARFLALYMFVSCIEAIIMDVQMGQERCVKMEIGQDLLVTGNFDAKPIIQNRKLFFKISDANGNAVYENRDALQGNFAFTTQQEVEYSFCFVDQPVDGSLAADMSTRMVSFKVHTGEQAKDYAEVARQEKLKPIELSLRKLEDTTQKLRDDFTYMKNRESRHRDTSESTNARVMWMSFFSLVILSSLGLWQIYYLKTYFKSKKLI